ncbi:MAG: thioesterase family protein [Zavarzinella sp.]
MTTPFISTRRVEFGETDMAGIVHFSNFFRYMESAETDMLMSLGFSVNGEENGVAYGFPRVSVTCDFARPARFADQLQIHVAVEEIGQKSVRYRYTFFANDVQLAVGRITAVHCIKVDGQMKSHPLPERFRQQLEKYLLAPPTHSAGQS